LNRGNTQLFIYIEIEYFSIGRPSLWGEKRKSQGLLCRQIRPAFGSILPALERLVGATPVAHFRHIAAAFVRAI
jgi:hypothetical protein